MSRRGAVAAPILPTTRDGRAILSRATLDQYDHAPQRSGGRERYYCPLHGGDNQRSLSVDPTTGQYTCHACGATGTLREHWPNAPQDGKGKPPKQMTLEEMGRRELAARAQLDQEHAARLAGEIPAAATAFLAQLPAMQVALRRAGCPGAAYLRARGLDPLLAADLGAGYAAPNVGVFVQPLKKCPTLETGGLRCRHDQGQHHPGSGRRSLLTHGSPASECE